MTWRIVKRIWTGVFKVLFWSPFKTTREFNWFHSLFTIGILCALLGATWNDDIWYYHNQSTEDEQDYTAPEPDWNEPLMLDLDAGICLDVLTHKTINC